MPVLKNSRWEKFVQNKAEGTATGPAYTAAGYRAKGRSADTAGGRLLTIVEIRARIDEIQGATAQEIADIKELARSHTAAAVNTLAEIMEDKKAPKNARVMAANGLLDRGHGKAPQTIDMEPTVYDSLPLPQRLALAAAIGTLIADAEGDQGGPGPTKH